MRTWHWIVGVVLASVSTSPAADWRFASGPSRVTLLELYTSEGCSSCPPAEKWLGEQGDDPGLWKRRVPISFHVTYWDYLGWQDALAQPAFTARQRSYASHWRSGSVYTPCFVRDGVEWRPGEAEKTDGVAGKLVALARTSGEWELTFTPVAGMQGDFDGHIAILGRGIISRVRAGENKGRTLAHDFVALDLVEAPLKVGASDNERTAVFKLKAGSISTESRAIAAWATRRGEIEPIQATGGDLK